EVVVAHSAHELGPQGCTDLLPLDEQVVLSKAVPFREPQGGDSVTKRSEPSVGAGCSEYLGARLGRRGLGGYRMDVGNAAHPLPLIGGVLPRGERDRVDRLGSWQLCDLAEADDLARGVRDRAAAGALDLLLHPGREHGLGPCTDSLVENGLRDVEPDDQRRVAGLLAPEAVARRSERPSSLVQLEGPDDSATIVGVDRLRRLRISLGEGRVRLLGAAAVVHTLPALARPGGWRGRQVEFGERSAEVEAGAADDDGRASACKSTVDRLVREALILGHRALIVERPDSDKGGRPLGL